MIIFAHRNPTRQSGMNEIRFTKMHGAGNDYIYIDCMASTPDNLSDLAIEMSRRHFSIGADGIILICPSEKADLKMRIFNADGSEAKMCGNASRCVGKYAYEHGLVNGTSLSLETLGGIKYLKLHVDDASGKVNRVSVDMGEAAFDTSAIPVESATDTFIEQPVMTPEGGELQVTAVSMGNPHGVVFVNHYPTDREVLETGKWLERHDIWPERANIEFAQVTGTHKLNMRVWERGSGETWACGTGACAAAAAAVVTGRCEFPVTVELRGGTLIIDRRHDGHIMMDGPAEEVFSGIYKIKKPKD